MFRRALVPLDGSADAETILDHLAPFFAPSGETILLHVLPEPHPATGTNPELWLTLQRGADAYLANVPRRGVTGPIKTFVDVGDPGGRILKVAAAVKADLVAMVTHAWRGLPRIGLGEVARKVLREVQQPVLFVQPGIPASDRGLRRILVPLEGPGWSPAEVDPLLPVAAERGAEVVFLHVQAPEPDPMEGKGIDPPLTLAAHDRLRRYQEAADYVRSFGVQARAVVGLGEPVRQILGHAKSIDADLIAMTTHGRSGLEQWVAGSVAARVVRAAECPVLVLRKAHVLSRAVPGGTRA